MKKSNWLRRKLGLSMLLILLLVLTACGNKAAENDTQTADDPANLVEAPGVAIFDGIEMEVLDTAVSNGDLLVCFSLTDLEQELREGRLGSNLSVKTATVTGRTVERVDSVDFRSGYNKATFLMKADLGEAARGEELTLTITDLYHTEYTPTEGLLELDLFDQLEKQGLADAPPQAEMKIADGYGWGLNHEPSQATQIQQWEERLADEAYNWAIPDGGLDVPALDFDWLTVDRLDYFDDLLYVKLHFEVERYPWFTLYLADLDGQDLGLPTFGRYGFGDEFEFDGTIEFVIPVESLAAIENTRLMLSVNHYRDYRLRGTWSQSFVVESTEKRFEGPVELDDGGILDDLEVSKLRVTGSGRNLWDTSGTGGRSLSFEVELADGSFSSNSMSSGGQTAGERDDGDYQQSFYYNFRWPLDIEEVAAIHINGTRIPLEG